MTFDKRKYDQNYAKEYYDRIALNVKKGEKAKMLLHAKDCGFESLTDYIKALIYADMQGSKNISVGDVIQHGDNNSINIG